MGGYWYVDSQPYSAVLDALIAASNSSQIVLTTGTYSDPGFIASLAASKITGTLAKSQQHAQTAYYDAAGIWAQAQTFNGSRPIVANGSTGFLTTQGDSGGFLVGLRALGASGSALGDIGTRGANNTLAYHYIGFWDDPIAAFYPDLHTEFGGGIVADGSIETASFLRLNTYLYSTDHLVLTVPEAKGVYTQVGPNTKTVVFVDRAEFYVPVTTSSNLTVGAILNIGSSDCRLFRDDSNLYIESDGFVMFRDTSSSTFNMLVKDGVLRIGDTSGKPMIAPSYDGNAAGHFPCGLVVEPSTIAIGLAWGMYQNGSASWLSGWNYASVPRTALLNNFDGLRYIATASTTATPGTVLSSQPTTVFSVSPSGVVTGELIKGPIDPRPITKAALLTLSATAASGEHRITDSTPAQRRAYPDGANWRYSDDSTIVT